MPNPNPHATDNVNPNELNKFSELAHEWWDEKGPCRPLHQLNPVRLGFIKQHARLDDKTVLDLGCGGGILSESLALEGANVTAVDLNSDVLNAAKLHLAESALNIDYQKISAEALAEQRPGQFDVIACMEMLEHVPDPKSILQACKTLLKPGGHLFLSTLNRTAKSYLLGIVAAEYILKLLPKGTHDYDQLIRPSELANWCRELELNLKDLKGIGYNPITGRAKLTRDVSINYIAHITMPD